MKDLKLTTQEELILLTLVQRERSELIKRRDNVKSFDNRYLPDLRDYLTNRINALESLNAKLVLSKLDYED